MITNNQKAPQNINGGFVSGQNANQMSGWISAQHVDTLRMKNASTNQVIKPQSNQSYQVIAKNASSNSASFRPNQSANLIKDPGNIHSKSGTMIRNANMV